MSVAHDPNLIGADHIRKLVGQFSHILRQISQDGKRRLSRTLTLGSCRWDLGRSTAGAAAATSRDALGGSRGGN